MNSAIIVEEIVSIIVVPRAGMISEVVDTLSTSEVQDCPSLRLEETARVGPAGDIECISRLSSATAAGVACIPRIATAGLRERFEAG